MKQLIINPDYLGLNITKKIFILNANVTLDTTKEYTQQELAAYYRLDEFKTIIQEIYVDDNIFDPEVSEVINNVEDLTITINEDNSDKGITNITFIKTDDTDKQFIHFNEEIKNNEIKNESKQKGKRGRKPNKI